MRPVVALAAVAGIFQDGLQAQQWQPTRVPSGNVAHISTAGTPERAASSQQPNAGNADGWSPNRPTSSPSRSANPGLANQTSNPVAANDQAEAALRWKKPEQFSSATSVQTANGSSSDQNSNWAPQRQIGASQPLQTPGPKSRVRFASQVATSAGQPMNPVGNQAGSNTQRRFTAQDAFGGNPLRSSTAASNELRQPTAAAANPNSPVRLANYQQAGDVFGDNFGTPLNGAQPNGGLPQAPNNAPLQFTQPQSGNAGLPQLPQAGGAFGADPGAAPQGAMDLMQGQGDPLGAVEPPPAPGVGNSGAPALPSETQESPSNAAERPNPFDDDAAQSMGDTDRFGDAEVVPSPDPVEGEDDEDFLKRDDSSSITCNEKRNRIRPRPLREVSLDVSPAFGEGLRAVRNDSDEQRLEFVANARIRDWYDYRNSFVTTGRLIDLRDDRIILDANGVERKIALQDLSDVDLAYVGEAWNIPLSCGTGNETFTGRNFTASTVQWKAPGHCHKPLYFEQTQLERYGHEAGPIVQPLISTAHFFANIAVLPYKMGIHPPNECQYSLGYYRPGNCAPYMVQPLPLSLRGAAAQAGFVTGAGALIP